MYSNAMFSPAVRGSNGFFTVNGFSPLYFTINMPVPLSLINIDIVQLPIIAR